MEKKHLNFSLIAAAFLQQCSDAIFEDGKLNILKKELPSKKSTHLGDFVVEGRNFVSVEKTFFTDKKEPYLFLELDLLVQETKVASAKMYVSLDTPLFLIDKMSISDESTNVYLKNEQLIRQIADNYFQQKNI